MSTRLLHGDCRSVLKSLPSESVHCVVTSPPYFGLRDYGVSGQIGLEATPDAYVAEVVEVFREVRRILRPDGVCFLNLGDSYAEKQLLGIPWKVAFALQQPYYSGRIKNETDRVWLAAMIDGKGCMFIHKRKAGTDSGAKWTKADGVEVSYNRTQDTYGRGLEVANTSEAIVVRCRQITGVGSICRQDKDRRQPLYRWSLRSNECRWVIEEVYPYLVGKQHQARLLLGCPSSGPKAEASHAGLMTLHNGGISDVDFAAPESLFQQGFYLRQDIIWSKLNPMPESVRDRCTKAHEYLFLLSKSPRYHYDADAIRDEPTGRTDRMSSFGNNPNRCDENSNGYALDGLLGRNKRSVWEVATQPFSGSHFAVFPTALIEPCILAGCPAKACATCGKPWVREVERSGEWRAQHDRQAKHNGEVYRTNPGGGIAGVNTTRLAIDRGFSPSCSCNAATVPGTVLDPFAGAGTTGMVADRLGRNAILIELNASYADMSKRRITDDAPLFAEVVAA
jgi:DNA modification methylase